MRRLVPFLLLMLLLPVAGSSQRRRTPQPKRFEIVEQKTKPLTYGVLVEKYATNYSIKGDGTALQTVEMEQKCVLAGCVERMKKWEQIYNAELQSLRLIGAHLVKKNGKRIDLTKDNGVSLPTPQAESAPDFSSLRQLEISFPGYEIGDTISYKLEIETTKPIFGKHFDSLELYPAVFGWSSIEVNVTAPADYAIHFDTAGLEGGEVASANSLKSWRWRRSGVAALPLETAMYDTQRTSPRFAVTTFSSFEQLGAAFGEGVRQKAVITPELQALADEITKDLKDPSDQAAAIYQWVNKNIRYLLVVLDRGGWIPHSTEQILKNRYGDCKDYTTLIYAMLKAKGIESVPVLINSKFGNWFPKVATMEHFDHAVLYIPKLELFADATSPNTRLGLIPQTLVGKTALQSGEKPGLISVPQNRPDDNQLLSEVDVEILENGTLRSRVSNVFAGRSEILFRPIFSDAKRTGLADHLVKFQLAFYGLTGSGRVLEISDPHAVADPFSIKLEVEIPDFTTFTPKGSLTIPAGINTLSMASLEAFAKDEHRNTDLFTGATRLRESFRIKVPQKVIFSELPADVKFVNLAGSFEMGFSKTPQGIELRRELVLLKDSFEPIEYAAFKELIASAVSALNTAVPYVSDGSLTAKRPTPRRVPQRQPATGLRDVLSDMYGLDEKPLGAAEVRRLEARLSTQPNDIETREKLLRHYGRYDLKETPAIVKARKEHKLWLIRNRPEKARSRLLGWYFSNEKNSDEYIALRDEWKKQIASKPADVNVWLNAVELVQHADPLLAEEMLADGQRLHPESYEYPHQISLLLANRLDDARDPLSPNQRAEVAKRSIENGKRALFLLKKERSEIRDSDRAELLISLAPAVLESGDIDFAESLARELVLDFGGDPSNYNFEKAAHVGNTILGKAALARNDVARAAEHLMISVKAPLRKPAGYFSDIDLSLAAQLFKKGEKKVVSEFLSSALKISGFVDSPDLNEDEIAALKKWIAEIEKGSQPTFDFEKP